MDDLSKELQDYLIRLGKDEKSVGEKLAGYTRQLINILYSSDARILEEYYGLFGNEPQSLDQLSARYKTTPDIMEKGIEACLRKIAVSPEWQQIKPMTKLRAIKLK
ncbi:MAG: hypothetical protein SPL37_05830 [Prevotella sp.]|jgi:DNA-directed RNA polymerase sigma subunit (sigma70/sigma32)|nr:hypothetical protein [Prevotella sp.]MDY6319040.1 hypothetical protein [Prevotella sp.]